MAGKSPPGFRNETQEADWRAKNRSYIADRLEQTKAAGRMGKVTVAWLARERIRKAEPSPTITIRLAEDDLARARNLAAEKGLRYQTSVKLLLHQTLDSEEKRALRA